MDIANRTLKSLTPLVITTRDAALVKQTNCDATKRMTIDCRHTRCPSLDEYSNTNPACMDEELTKCGVHVRSDARRATTPEECLKSTTCSVMVAYVPLENIFKSVGLSDCVFPSLSLFLNFAGEGEGGDSHLACGELVLSITFSCRHPTW